MLMSLPPASLYLLPILHVYPQRSSRRGSGRHCTQDTQIERLHVCTDSRGLFHFVHKIYPGLNYLLANDLREGELVNGPLALRKLTLSQQVLLSIGAALEL